MYNFIRIFHPESDMPVLAYSDGENVYGVTPAQFAEQILPQRDMPLPMHIETAYLNDKLKAEDPKLYDGFMTIYTQTIEAVFGGDK